MKLSTVARVIGSHYFNRSLRNSYWAAFAFANELRALYRPHNAAFRKEVIRSLVRFMSSAVVPITEQAADRARSAAGWILRAQSATQDNGVSLGYFPCSAEPAGWRPSYPETTGYIITSLLEYAEMFGDAEASSAAIRMAEWETEVQMPSGAVQGGAVCDSSQQTAAAFNTGMVLDGWCSAFSQTGDSRFFEAARRAADFLVNDLDERAYFRTNGAFVSAGEIKTYTCLCAWAVYRFGVLAGEERYETAAVAVIEAALRQQLPNGWFAHNCLNNSEAPLTHTIGYTLQGVLEVGVLAGRQDFVAAVRHTVDAMLPRMAGTGYLPARFFADWEPAAFSSCLTGSSQVAIVCYRLAAVTGERRYGECADKLINYLKALQSTDSSDPALVGGMPGSFPLLGGYMRAGYPNWATKYFLDALILQIK